jgi:hypothetical protein
MFLKGRASPRSASFTTKSLVTRKLRLLMSQCMRPLECRKATPAQQSRIICRRRRIGKQKPNDCREGSPVASRSPAGAEEEVVEVLETITESVA